MTLCYTSTLMPFSRISAPPQSEKMHEDHMFRGFLLTWATLFDGGIVRS